MTNPSPKHPFWRKLPGLAAYFNEIDRLHEEREAAIARLGLYAEGLDKEAAEKMRTELETLVADNRELTDRCTSFSSHLDVCQKESAILRLDLSRIAQERDAANVENSFLRQQIKDQSTLQETLSSVHQTFDSYHKTTLGAIANLSAGNVGLATRQEEAIARLGRVLRHNVSKGVADGRPIDLYLDLLEASLTGILYEDGTEAPWITTNEFNASTRAIGRDWPKQALTMIGTARMRNLRMLLRQALDDKITGDFVEAGVWRGGACIYAKGILDACGAEDRKVFVADSFRGLPEPNVDLYAADAGDIHSTFPELAIPLSVVRENFRRYGLLDDNVIFLEGWFKDTLHTADIKEIAVLRLDGDMYESTMDTLTALYGKVSKGGFVIVDDYILKACAQAVDDFRRDNHITQPLHPVDDAAVWWRV